MAARELVTIQCGHFSNFIGTHWWNLQQSEFCYDTSSKDPLEILHDCMFREGLTLTGQQTYTPRLIAIDLPGSLKTLKEEGLLYETEPTEETPAWQGVVDVHKQEEAEKNELLKDLDKAEEEMDTADEATVRRLSPPPKGREEEPKSYHLDNSVEAWSDFLCLHLHSKSLLMVPGHVHNDSDDSFGMYPAGVEVWENKKFQHQLEDKVHFFVEECDRLQGFQLLSDWTDGFGGLASSIAQDLRDEYGSKGLLVTLSSPLTSPLDKLPAFHPSLFNHILALNELSSHSSLLCPLSLLSQPWRSPPSLRDLEPLTINPSLFYHASAIFASAVETASLFYRTEQSPISLAELSDHLTATGRRISSMGLSLPLLLPSDGTLSSYLDQSPLPSSLTSLSPFATSDDVRWSQAVCLRGLPLSYPLSSPEDPRYVFCRHPSHTLAAHLAETAPSINSQLCYVQKPLPLATPFPHILPPEHMKAGHTSTCASLLTQSGTWQLLSTLLTELKRAKLKQFPSFSSSCLDEDSCSELVQNLSSLAESYSTGVPDSLSDSD